MNQARAVLCWIVCSSTWLAAAAGEIAVTDRNGRINTMLFDGDDLAVQTDLRLPVRGWKRLPGMGHARRVKLSRSDGRRTWTGRIQVAKGQSCRFEQTIEEAAGAVRVTLKVTAEADLNIEGVFFWLDAPIDVFAGGACTLAEDSGTSRSAEMPRTMPAKRHFLSAKASRITMVDGTDNVRLSAALDRACRVVVQDTRVWKGKVYSAFATLHAGPLARGQGASLKATLKLTGRADDTPARLSLDAARIRYRLDGFGGNYCFGIESPVTQYTLDNLRVAWARTEMTLGEWEPQNDNDSPTRVDWPRLENGDKPGSNLRREFLLAKQIQDRGTPYSITIWRLPEWLYAEPGKGPGASRRRVAPGKWPEVLECIGSYLLYAKREYGVEPDLFSFNEANIGCRVLFSAEEHRDAIKRIGAHFQKLGLRTKMLLADATGPRGTHTYALPAASDPEAMRHVGAVGFHSWGGASPTEYGAWADLAEGLKLPLLVTELGVDAHAWRGRSFDSFHYGMREVRMYQEILLHARPRGAMQWELTSDYGIVRAEKASAEGGERLIPTPRFWFVKHFCDLTPPRAGVLLTASDHAKVLFTAFVGEADGARVYTCHVANLGAGREAVVSGLPPGIMSWRAVRTSETDAFRSLPPVSAVGGSATLNLAPRSLLTLTTMSLK